MSKPSKPTKAKLFTSIIYSSCVDKNEVIDLLKEKWGAMDFVSDEINFTQTEYYRDEMGSPLKRIFVSFSSLISRDRLSDAKISTNDIENKFLKNDKRAVNIDPGLITLENMVLATGKNYSHRIYLKDGIFAEITLIYKDGGYSTLEWTYPDYAGDEILAIMRKIRDIYKGQLKNLRRQYV